MRYFSNKAVKQEDGSYKIIKPNLDMHSEIVLKAGDLPNVKELTRTTVGRALANKMFLVDPFGDFYDYINEPIVINNIINMASGDMMNGKITNDQLIKLFNNITFITKFGDMILPSIDENLLVTPPKVKALTKKLVNEHKDLLDAGDLAAIPKVEKPIMDELVKEIKDKPSFMMYTMKKPSIGNNLKQTVGIFSPMLDYTTGKLVYPKGNLSEGIDPKDYSYFVNMNVDGTYGRAVETADGGAIVKSLYGSMNMVKVDKAGSDCGSTRYITINLTKFNYQFYKWSYMYVNGGLVLLSDDNKHKFIGTTVKLRTSLFCKTKSTYTICNKCAGELPYKLGFINIGILTAKVGFSFVQMSMNLFHNSTISVTNIDPFKYLD